MLQCTVNKSKLHSSEMDTFLNKVIVLFVIGASFFPRGFCQEEEGQCKIFKTPVSIDPKQVRRMWIIRDINLKISIIAVGGRLVRDALNGVPRLCSPSHLPLKS